MIINFILFLFQFNINAGIVEKYNTKITTSSGFYTEENGWYSDNLLPDKWVLTNNNNFLNLEKNKIYDGDLNTSESICNNYVKTNLQLNENFLIKADKECQIYFYKNNKNVYKYDYRNIYQAEKVKINEFFDSYAIINENCINIFEISAYNLLYEAITLELDSLSNIGQIKTQFRGIYNDKILLKLSSNNIDYICVDTLYSFNPKPYFTIVDNKVKFVRLEFLIKENYQKAEIYKIEIYDKYGIFKKPKDNVVNKTTINEFLGVKSVWNFGGLKDTFDYNLDNYHFLIWDWNFEENLDYNCMAINYKNGCLSQSWLNWDDEYLKWKNNNELFCTLQFDNLDGSPTAINQNLFSNNKGKILGEKFSYFNKTFDYILIGNEPWDYTDSCYKQICSDFIDNFDKQNVKLFPCALQSCIKDNMYSETEKNYISKLDSTLCFKLDGFNGHYYSYKRNNKGVRYTTNPEDLSSDFRAMINDLHFRDINMPNKMFIVSEFGYDCESNDEKCNFSECLNEQQQNDYTVRSILLMMRFGVDRANYFMMFNSPYGDGLYSKSGIYNSIHNNFSKKKLYYTIKNLKSNIGEYHFYKIINEKNNIYDYLFINKNNKIIRIIWTDKQQKFIYLDKKPYKIKYLNHLFNDVNVLPIIKLINKKLYKKYLLKITETPIIIYE